MTGSRPSSEMLVERDDDLARLDGALREDRLVTLLGPGGVGKSALASAALERWLVEGGRGWLIDAASVGDASALVPAILAALGDDADGDPLAAVSAAAGSGALLVLDNLEPLVPAATDVVAALLRAAPGLRVVCTSRVPLGAPGEREWPVSPLSVPSGDDAASVGASGAGRLLELRLRAVASPHVIDDRTSADLARLLRLLDGLPLAVELAAGRLRALAPAELLERLASRGLRGLDDGRDARRSLSAVLAASFAMLAPDERRLLEAGAAAARFDHAYAEAQAGGDALDAVERLLLLGLLARADPVDGGSRFRLLETVRAGVRAEASAAAIEAADEAHARYWLAMSERLVAARDRPSLAWLDGWADDLRLALARLTRSDPRGALALWTRLDGLWQTRHRGREGLEAWNAIALPDDPTPLLARALSRHVALRFAVDGVAAAAAENQHALDVARASGDRASLVEALAGSAMVALETGDAVHARAAADEAAALVAELDDPRLLALAAQSRAFAVSATDGEASVAARDAVLELVAAATAAADPGLELTARGDLAVTHVYRGDYPAAARAAAEALALARSLGSPLEGWVQATHAIALGEAGDASAAGVALAEVADRAASGASGDRAIDALVAAASALRATGHPRDALVAAACARATLASGAATAQPGDLALLARFEQAATRQVTPVDAELARQDGATIGWRAFLRSIPARLAAKPVRPERGRVVGGLRLTPREVEILALVGAGRTDPEIADELFISAKTASVHVANIKAKLELDTRVRLALRARELGLEPPPPDAGLPRR